MVAILSRGSSLPRDQTWVFPKLQAESLPPEPQYIAIYNLINFKISAYWEPNTLLGNRNTKQDMIVFFLIELKKQLKNSVNIYAFNILC